MKLDGAVYLLENYGVYGFDLDGIFLLGMPYPSEKREFWKDMNAAGIKGVLCLSEDPASYDPSPLEIIGAAALSDNSALFSEALGEAEAVRYRSLSKKGAALLKQGHSLAVHCKGGTGWTGTIIGAILLELGYPVNEVLKALESANMLRNRGDHGWPESPWQKNFLLDYHK